MLWFSVTVVVRFRATITVKVNTTKTIASTLNYKLPEGAQWPSGLERWTGDRVVLGSNPAAESSLRNFGNSVYPAVPLSFGGYAKSLDPFYLGPMSGEVKYPSSLHWNCVTCRELLILALRRTTL